MDISAIGVGLGIIVLVGQGFFFMGILWNKTQRNSRDIEVIFNKIDYIHEYVKKNGPK